MKTDNRNDAINLQPALLYDEDQELINFKLNEIEPDPNNAMPAEDIERFANDEIMPVGRLIHPVTVRRMDSGKYRLVSGERRWLAFKYLNEQYPDDRKWKTIPGYVIEIESDTEHAISSIIANFGQRTYSEYDRAMLAAKLLELYQQRGMTVPESIKTVATHLNISQSQMYRMSEFTKVPEEIKEAVRDNKIAMSVANMIAKTDEKTQNDLMELVNAGIKLPREEVQRFIKLSSELQASKPADKNELTQPSELTNDADDSINNSSNTDEAQDSMQQTSQQPIQQPTQQPADPKDMQKQFVKQLNAFEKQYNKLYDIIAILDNNGITIPQSTKDKLTNLRLKIFSQLGGK